MPIILFVLRVNGAKAFKKEGIKYSLNEESKTAIVTGQVGLSGDLIIPAEVENGNEKYKVTEIGKGAFEQHLFSGELKLPDGLTYIGADAFYNCKFVGDIIIPEGVTEIGFGAFEGCGTGSLVIPDSVTEVGKRAFWNAKFTGDLTIGSGIEELTWSFLGDNLSHETVSGFQGNLTLASKKINRCFFELNFRGRLILREGVESFADYVFYKGSFSGDLVLPKSIKELGKGVFRESGSYERLEIKADMVEIPFDIFSGCKFAGDVVLPEGVESIGQYAFEDCQFSKVLTLPQGLKKIDTRGFAFCKFAGDLELPEGLKEIGGHVFWGATGINYIKVPDSVTKMGKHIFFEATDLEKIDHLKVASAKGALPEIDNPPIPFPDVRDYESRIDATKDDTMMQKSAKWTNENLTEAEIRIDYGRAEVNSRADIVFVLDQSGSMWEPTQASLGETLYTYPKAFILDDIIGDAMKMVLDGNENEYDNRIAVTAFGSSELWSTPGFTTDQDVVQEQVKLVLTDQNTNYTDGLQKAIDLIKERTETKRTPVVIFLSDGLPNMGDGLSQAQELRDAGVKVYPIAISSSDAGVEDALRKLSYDGQTVYDGMETSSFETVMGEVITEIMEDVPTFHTVVEDTLSESFDFATGTDSDISVSADGGTAKIEGNKVIWTMADCKAGIAHTLKIKVKSTKQDASGALPTNSRLISQNDGIDTVNSPELERYIVTHKFVSQNAGHELPQEVKELLPAAKGGYRSGAEVVYTDPAKKEVQTSEGVIWRFLGWDKETDQVERANVQFVGEWMRLARVKISKVDADTNEPLSGAAMVLLDQNGATVAEWVSTKDAYILNDKLIPGQEYTVKEKNAPTGYLLASSFTFTAKVDGSVTEVVMKDKKKAVPVNGDKTEVKITKYVMYEGKYRSMDYSFYAALFWDEKCTQRATEVVELKLDKSYTASAVISDLPKGIYYLAETDD